MSMTPRKLCGSKWLLPAVFVVCGLLVAGAALVAGDVGYALFAIAFFTAVAIAIAAGGRSETIRGLRGDGTDERFRAIDLSATAFAGSVVILAVVIAFVVQIARGQDGNPYAWLAAIGGAAYIGAYVRGARH
jgi:hypothetical protein